MKYKIPILLLLLFTFSVFTKTCLDFNKGNPLLSLMNSMQPESTIIKNGVETVITKPGSYHLIENIIGNITVDVDNVIVELNGFTIEYHDRDVIRIEPGHQNVIIRNGTIITSGAYEGVQLYLGVKNVILENLKIYGGDKAIYLGGFEGTPIECCLVRNCVVTGCDYGLFMAYANNCVFKDCEVCECKYGFHLENCKYNKFKQCKAIRIGHDTADSNAYGFAALSGWDNLFYECMAEGIYKVDSDWFTKAMGFVLGYRSESNIVEERESKIIDCCVDSVAGAGFGNAFGIYLEGKASSLLTSVTAGLFDDVINDVDWSPQGDYVAIACSDGTVRVLHFDGQTLREVDRVELKVITNPADSGITDIVSIPANAVAWAPDGHHLAVGTDGFAEIESRQAWVSWISDSSQQVDNLHTVTFLHNVKKELLVYRFDSELLTLVDDEHVGINDVTIYDGDTQVLSESYYSTISTPTIVTTPGLPGPIRTLKTSEVGSYIQNKPIELGQAKAPDDILRIVWSRDGRHIFVTTKGGKNTVISSNTNLQIGTTSNYAVYTYLNFDVTEEAKLVNFTFDGANLNLVENRVVDVTNSSKALALTPDDNGLVYGLSEKINTLNIASFAKFYGTVDVLADNLTSGTSVKNADWNPIASRDKYYLAVVGYAGSPAQNLEVFEYNYINNALTSLTVEDIDADLTDVKWAPDGKSLVVTGTTLIKYDFDPSLSASSVLTYVDYIPTPRISGDKWLDWSPCGRFIVMAGDIQQLYSTNIEVISAGICVMNCVVQNNKVANVSGGLCAIGIMAPGCCNLIDKNLLSGNGVNASEGVFNTFYDMKVSNMFIKPRPLDNLAFEGFCCTSFCS
ncbi:NosD domain-containing protein [Candidatus Dependentiae bacterium]